MSKTLWVVIAMIVWAIISMYWYCSLQGSCGQKPEAVVVTDTLPQNDVVVEVEPIEQPVAEAPEVIEEEVLVPLEDEEEEVEEELVLEEVAETVVRQECTDYLDGNLRPGSSANSEQVATKVENFLNQYEGEDLPVDGEYGSQDVAAINAFQQKYAAEVLTPLGLTESTGNVLGSTRAQINELYCQNANLER